MKREKLELLGRRILFTIVFAFLIILFGTRASVAITASNTKKYGTIVEAEIIETVYTNLEGANEYGGGNPRYNLRYLYVDENGVEYTNVIPFGTYDEAFAEEQIGKFIPIYIDGKGNSLAVDYVYENYTWPILREAGICALCSAGFIAYITVSIRLEIRKKRAAKAAVQTLPDC
ncbi:MAG: hypothetical protein LBP26_00995 [Clostridiales bacterium]|jgi:hypothetical protein|nr:hypothetical protein [Clostridiales bacterium]